MGKVASDDADKILDLSTKRLESSVRQSVDMLDDVRVSSTNNTAAAAASRLIHSHDISEAVLDSSNTHSNSEERTAASSARVSSVPLVPTVTSRFPLHSNSHQPHPGATAGCSPLFDQVVRSTTPDGVLPSVKRVRHHSDVTDSTETSRPTSSESTGDVDDVAYVERRRKNNEAAKRSRDARRQKERQTAVRAAALEHENVQLRAELAVLRSQAAKLHYLLCNKHAV